MKDIPSRDVAARWAIRFRFVCRDIYPIRPILLTMIAGCSCIRPVSKTNRSYIYQQFKAAGRDCRCPVGFLRVSPSSYCGSICYLDCNVNWGIERSWSRKLYRDICTSHGYEYHRHYRYPEIRSALINNATAILKKKKK